MRPAHDRESRADKGRQGSASRNSNGSGPGASRWSSSSSILDPAMNAEFLQLVAKHAPLELDLLSVPAYTSLPQEDSHVSAPSKHSPRGSNPASRRHTSGSNQSHDNKHPTYHVRSETNQQTVSIRSAPASRGNVPPNPKLLANPVEEERARARQRASAAAAIAERTRHEAQAHRHTQAKALKQDAQLMASVVSKAAPVPEEHIKPVISVHQPASKPASAQHSAKSHPPAVHHPNTSQPTSTSTHAPRAVAGTAAHPPKPSETAATVAAGLPAGVPSGRITAAQVASSIAAELAAAPASDAAAAAQQAASGVQPRKTYPRPWTANMLKSTSKPTNAPPVPATAPGNKAGQDVAPSPPAPPPSVLPSADSHPTGTAGAAAGSHVAAPGVPSRVHQVDPETHAHLIEYMHRKRAEVKQRLKDEADQVKAAQMKPLVHRREASAVARMEARRRAAEAERRPVAHVRRAWVDADPNQHVSIPTTTHIKRRAVSAGRGHYRMNDTDSEPDIDAVSIRAQPNHTRHGMARDARGGSKFRIQTAKEHHGGFMDESDSVYGQSQVIRVRDPARAKSASRSPPPMARASLLARDNTVVMRAGSPSKPIDVRYVDVLTRRTAAWEYAEKLRQTQLEQLRQQQQAARSKLRMLRKVQRKQGSKQQPGWPAGTAALAAALFPKPGHKASEKKRRPAAEQHMTAAGLGQGWHSNTAAASRPVTRGGAHGRQRQGQAAQMGSLFEPVSNLQLPGRGHGQVAEHDAGPTDEAVAALRELVLQLSKRIEGLQQEAQEERERMAAPGPRTAWEEAPQRDAQHAQHDMPWEVPGASGVHGQQQMQQWAVPEAQRHHHHHHHQTQAVRQDSVHGGHHHHHHHHHQEDVYQHQHHRHQVSGGGAGGSRMSQPAPSAAAGLGRHGPSGHAHAEHHVQHVSSRVYAGQDEEEEDGRDSPDALVLSMKKPRLSLEDQVPVLPAPHRPSCIPTIRVPTSTRHTVPDPSVPFPAWSPSAGLREEDMSSDEEMRQHRRSTQLMSNHIPAPHPQRQSHSQPPPVSAQPTFSPSSSSHHSSSDNDDDDDDGHRHHERVLGIEDLLGVAMDDDDDDDDTTTGLGTSYVAQAEHAGALHHGSNSNAAAGRGRHSTGADPHASGSGGGARQPQQQQPQRQTGGGGGIRGVHVRHDSLSLAGSDTGPLSPDSDLLSHLPRQARPWADPSDTPACQLVVQQQEQAAGHPLKVGPAARALQLAAREEQQVQAGARAVSASLKRTAADVDSDSDTFTFPSHPFGDPLSVINIAARQMIPRRPISISLPQPAGAAVAAASHPTSVPQSGAYQLGANTGAPAAYSAHAPSAEDKQPNEMLAGLPPYLITYGPSSALIHSQRPAPLDYTLPDELDHYTAPAYPDVNSSPAPHGPYTAAGLPGMEPSIATSPAHAPAAGRVVQGGGALLQPPADARPRVSPADLQNQLMMHMRRLDEMERVDAELSQLEQARAIAAVQQEAHRIATTLDQTLAAQQQVAVTRAMAEQQENKLKSIADSMRQELRTESLSQLKDVASMFVQHIKCSRVAHAEVQTSILDPAPGLPTIMDAAVGTSPSHSIGRQARGSNSSSATAGKTTTRAAGKRAAGSSSDASGSLNAELTEEVRHRQAQAAREETASGDLYSDAFESASKSGEQLLWPEARGQARAGSSGSIEDDVMAGPRLTSNLGHTLDGSSDLPEDALPSTDGLGRVVASDSNTYSMDTLMEDSAAVSASLGGPNRPQSRLATATHPITTASIASGSFPGTESASGVMDEVSLAAGSGALHGLGHSSPAGRHVHSQASPAGVKTDRSPATPLTAIRASPAGELCVPEPELLEMMQQVEASSQAELSRLQSRKAAVEAAAMNELQQLAQQLNQADVPQQRVNLMGLELKIKLKLNMEMSSIERQILALKDDMTLKKVQMHQLQRLVVTLSTPGSGVRPGSGLSPGVGPSRHTDGTPTRSSAIHLGGRAVPAAGGVSDGDIYSEDFDAGGGSSMQLDRGSRALAAGAGGAQSSEADVSDDAIMQGRRTSYDSQSSSALDQQRKQLEEELKRKQALLKAQQRKQAIAQLQAQVADVNKQLTRISASPGPAGGARADTPAGARGRPESDDAQEAGASSPSGSDSVIESGSAQSISDSRSQAVTVSDAYSIEDELQSAQRKQPAAAVRGRHQAVVSGAAKASALTSKTSTDSLAEAAQQVQRLQQEVERKKREAKRTQLAAQQAALQQQLQAADLELASAQASMHTRGTAGVRPTATNRQPSSTTDSIAYDEGLGAGRGVTRRQDSDDDDIESVSDGFQGAPRQHGSGDGSSEAVDVVDESGDQPGGIAAVSGSSDRTGTTASIQYSQAFTHQDQTGAEASSSSDTESEPEDLFGAVHDADDLMNHLIDVPEEVASDMDTDDHKAGPGQAVRSHPLGARSSRSLAGSSSSGASVETDGAELAAHRSGSSGSRAGSPPESEVEVTGRAASASGSASEDHSVSSVEAGAQASSSGSPSSVASQGAARAQHSDDGSSSSSGSSVREILMDIEDLQAMEDVGIEEDAGIGGAAAGRSASSSPPSSPPAEASESYTMTHSISTARSSHAGSAQLPAGVSSGGAGDVQAVERSRDNTSRDHSSSGGSGGRAGPEPGAALSHRSSRSSGGVQVEAPGLASRSLEAPSDHLSSSVIGQEQQEEEEEDGKQLTDDVDTKAQSSLGYTQDFEPAVSTHSLNAAQPLLSSRAAPKPVVASSFTGEVLLDASDLFDSLAISEEELLAAAQADSHSASFPGGSLSGGEPRAGTQPPATLTPTPAQGQQLQKQGASSSSGSSEHGVQGGVQSSEKSDEYETEFEPGSDADLAAAQAALDGNRAGSSSGGSATSPRFAQQSDSEEDLAQYQVKGASSNDDEEEDAGGVGAAGRAKAGQAAASGPAGKAGGAGAPLRDVQGDSHASTELDIEDDVQAAVVASKDGDELFLSVSTATSSQRQAQEQSHEVSASQAASKGSESVAGRQGSEAQPGVKRTGKGRQDDSDDSESSVSVSDYSMSFDGVDVTVDALPESPSKVSKAAHQDDEEADEDDDDDKQSQLVDGLATRLLNTALNDSIESIVSVAGGPGALSPSKPPPSSSSNQTSRAAHLAQQEETDASAAGEAAKQAVIDLTSHEQLEEGGQVAAAKQQVAIPGLRTLKRVDSDGSEASDGFDSVGITFTEDDLGWGDDDLGSYEFNLGGYVVPEVDQQQMRREAAAAAAPLVDVSPQAVAQYLEQVLNLRVKEHGAWPEVLQPGAEPLVLEGFLELERSLPDASEAQHITNKLLYDAANEALINMYKSTGRVKQPWWAGSVKVQRPLPAPDALVAEVQRQVQAWMSCKAGYDAELDKLLAQEAVEDERGWGSLMDEMAAGVKLDVADSLWEELLGDTAHTLRELEIKTAH